MHGTIEFTDLAEMAEFLKEFTGSTAKFRSYYSQGTWVIEFTGGF